jgi:hypothetical protein
MFTLTLKEVQQKACEYYLAKKLTAQHPDPSKRNCVNNGSDGYRCAVATAYPDDFKLEGKFYTLVYNLKEIECSPEDAVRIQRIQDAHDVWTSLSRAQSTDLTDFMEYRFLYLIRAENDEVDKITSQLAVDLVKRLGWLTS